MSLSGLHSLESELNLILVRLMKLRASPSRRPCFHWRGGIVAFQCNANRRFASSMRQRINVAALYAEAVKRIWTIDPKFLLLPKIRLPWTNCRPKTGTPC